MTGTLVSSELLTACSSPLTSLVIGSFRFIWNRFQTNKCSCIYKWISVWCSTPLPGSSSCLSAEVLKTQKEVRTTSPNLFGEEKDPDKDKSLDFWSVGSEKYEVAKLEKYVLGSKERGFSVFVPVSMQPLVFPLTSLWKDCGCFLT